MAIPKKSQWQTEELKASGTEIKEILQGLRKKEDVPELIIKTGGTRGNNSQGTTGSGQGTTVSQGTTEGTTGSGGNNNILLALSSIEATRYICRVNCFCDLGKEYPGLRTVLSNVTTILRQEMHWARSVSCCCK